MVTRQTNWNLNYWYQIIFELIPGSDGHQDNEQEQEGARPTCPNHLQP